MSKYFLKRLKSLQSLLHSSDEAELIFGKIIEVAEEESGSSYGALITVTNDNHVEVQVSAVDRWNASQEALVKLAFAGTKGIINAGGGQPLVFADVESDPGFIEVFPGTGSEVHVPVLAGDTLLGVLLLGSTKKNAFIGETLERLEVLAGLIASLLEQRNERQRQLKARRDLIRTERHLWSSKVLRGIAHEINSPLTAILGQCSILGSEVGSPETRAMVGQMQKSIERAGRFVARLNVHGTGPHDNLAQGDEGEEIGTLLVDLIQGLQMQLADDNIRIENALSDHLPLVRFSKGQLEGILLNLIENSARSIRELHGAEGGVITVESGHPQTGIVRLVVHDNGAGMDGKSTQSAFDPFFKGTSGSVPHRGLGLWLARESVREQDGHIWCESEPGQGTSFFIELPVAGAEGESIEFIEKEAEEQREEMRHTTRKEGPFEVVEKETPARKGGGMAGMRKLSLHVLVVDDEHYIREILATFFKACSCTVDKAEDGLNGLGMALQNDYDIVISDIRMPRMNGMEFYNTLVTEKPGFNGQFIFISGELMTNDYRDEVMDTDRPFLNKPFLPEDILNVVPISQAV